VEEGGNKIKDSSMDIRAMIIRKGGGVGAAIVGAPPCVTAPIACMVIIHIRLEYER